MVPLIYNSQDKGQATELINNILCKDTIVDIESTIKPSQMIKSKYFFSNHTSLYKLSRWLDILHLFDMSWQNIFIADVCHNLSKMWQPGRCSWQEKQPLHCTNFSFTLGIHAEFESMINCRWVCIVYHLIVPSCDLALIVVWFSFHECCIQVPQTTDICLLHVIYLMLDLRIVFLTFVVVLYI
jgi:hypothetical protein